MTEGRTPKANNIHSMGFLRIALEIHVYGIEFQTFGVSHNNNNNKNNNEFIANILSEQSANVKTFAYAGIWHGR